MKTTSRSSWVRRASTVVAFTALVAVPHAAHAAVSACGNMDISANAQCSLVIQNNCTTQCAPASCEEACAAQLEQTCNSQCNVSADASCTTACQSDCTTTCASSPPASDCTTTCNNNCQSGCSSQCTASASASASADGGSSTATASSSADCTSSCNACCDDHCSTQCVPVPTTANCTTKCDAACTGSCTAQVNATCQEQCQESSFATCKAQAASTCTTQCNQTVGAIFCDGNYIATENVEQCITDLNAILSVKIAATASGSCTGNNCTGKAAVKTTTSCTASPGHPTNAPVWAFGAAIIAAIAGTRRRARRG